MVTKTEAAGQVRAVLQGVKDRLAQPGGSNINEATTRAHFLNPLLNALGYSGIDDLVFEYYLPDGKTFLDYRLYVDGRARVAVEAKSLNVAITDKEAAQGVSYASILGDEWTVLTNARHWRLYHTFAPTALAGKLVLSLDLTEWQTDAEFDRLFDQLWLVSRESFQSGEGPNAWLTGQKVDHHLRHAMLDANSVELKYLRKRLEQQGIAVSTDAIAAWFHQSLGTPPAVEAPNYTITAPKQVKKATITIASAQVKVSAPDGVTHWLVPSGRQGGHSAEEHLQSWLGKGFWGFGAGTRARAAMKLGDQVLFYAAKGHTIVATARIAGPLDTFVGDDEWPGPGPFDPTIYKVPLTELTWLHEPIVLDDQMRATLDAFKGKDLSRGWSWFVQGSHRVTADDFTRLTSSG